MEKSADAFRTISEVAEDLDLPQHVLRFWETRFTQIKPLKRGGGRRYYRPEDVELLRAIRHLLYGEGYTIKGVQRILKEHGARAVAQMALTGMSAQDAPVRTALRPNESALRAGWNAAPEQATTSEARAQDALAQDGLAQDGAPLRTPSAPAPSTLRAPPPSAARAPSLSGEPLRREPGAGPTVADVASVGPQTWPTRPHAEPGSREGALTAAANDGAAPPTAAARLRPQEIERLKAALFELAECERLIAQARHG
jgi:DNA-binding transcriptional MerR regulator